MNDGSMFSAVVVAHGGLVMAWCGSILRSIIFVKLLTVGSRISGEWNVTCIVYSFWWCCCGVAPSDV